MFYWQQLWQQSLIAFLIKVAKFVNFAATIFNGQWSQISRFHGHKSKWHFCPSQPWNSITANLVFCEFMVFVGSPLSNCCWTEYYIPALNLNIWKGGSNIACLYVRIRTHMYVEQGLYDIHHTDIHHTGKTPLQIFTTTDIPHTRHPPHHG